MLIVQESSQQTVQVHHKQSPTPHYLQLFTMGFKNIPSGLLLAGFLQLLTSMQIFLRVWRFTTVPWHSTINNATIGPWEYPPSTAPTKAAVSVRNNYLRQTKVQNPTFSPSWIDLTIIWLVACR